LGRFLRLGGPLRPYVLLSAVQIASFEVICGIWVNKCFLFHPKDSAIPIMLGLVTILGLGPLITKPLFLLKNKNIANIK
jgi:hypothetical protein